MPPGHMVPPHMQQMPMHMVGPGRGWDFRAGRSGESSGAGPLGWQQCGGSSRSYRTMNRNGFLDPAASGSSAFRRRKPSKKAGKARRTRSLGAPSRAELYGREGRASSAPDRDPRRLYIYIYIYIYISRGGVVMQAMHGPPPGQQFVLPPQAAKRKERTVSAFLSTRSRTDRSVRRFNTLNTRLDSAIYAMFSFAIIYVQTWNQVHVQQYSTSVVLPTLWGSLKV